MQPINIIRSLADGYQQLQNEEFVYLELLKWLAGPGQKVNELDQIILHWYKFMLMLH